jgi:hypothetical protein
MMQAKYIACFVCKTESRLSTVQRAVTIQLCCMYEIVNLFFLFHFILATVPSDRNAAISRTFFDTVYELDRLNSKPQSRIKISARFFLFPAFYIPIYLLVSRVLQSDDEGNAQFWRL